MVGEGGEGDRSGAIVCAANLTGARQLFVSCSCEVCEGKKEKEKAVICAREILKKFILMLEYSNKIQSNYK